MKKRLFWDENGNKYEFDMRWNNSDGRIIIRPLEDNYPYRLIFKPNVGSSMIQSQYNFTPLQAQVVYNSINALMEYIQYASAGSYDILEDAAKTAREMFDV